MPFLRFPLFPGLSAASARETDQLIRAELFSVERLEQHAESLAGAQTVTTRPSRGQPLARRLSDNSRVLVAAYRAIGTAIREERAITPAAEWLVDNFHIAEEQIREIRDDLPTGFYRQLPKLSSGPLAGYPRVFGLAWAFVAHTDSLFDPQTLSRYVRAYQRVQPLTIAELWAVAITLRIVLVENLRRAAERIVSSRAARQAADALADRLLGVGGEPPAPATAALRRLEGAPLAHAFAVQLVQRLRDQDPAVTPALRWLDARLEAQGTTADEIVREEHQHQGAMNVTVRNVITSMRLLSAVDWADLFESVSLVDAMLCADSDFAAMDFATRDRYRHAIEELSRGSTSTELEVAARALAHAKAAHSDGPTECASGAALGVTPRGLAEMRHRRDPGYYLISNGRRDLETELGFRAPAKQWLNRACVGAGLVGYAAAIASLTLAALVFLGVALAYLALAPSMIAVLLALAFIPASDAAVAVVNHSFTHRLRAIGLPGLELRDGVPTDLRTLVAIPILLTTVDDIEEQIERLEVRFLASAEGDLRFALLSDWPDAPTESTPGDRELLAAGASGIARLNAMHGPVMGSDRFFLLHRRRVWSQGEGTWMGWERKRGKLHELNQLLRGSTDTTFITVDGHPPVLPANVRYVITLDSDTRLPHGAAQRLVGKMAHPLNRPVFDPDSGRVVAGYGILQPRVTPVLPSAHEGSLFQRVFSGPCGIDPYAFAASDVYQDLLGEGSYTGKGIYDIDVFEAAMAGRVPDGALLSHDLLEGIYARSGLVSDVEVVEEFPSRYDVSAARYHRWARGDWQLTPWILGVYRSPGATRGRAAMPFLGRWKMLDNLRRTMVAPMTFAALVVGWTLPTAAAALWTVGVVAMVALPTLIPFFSGLLPRREGISKRSHILAAAADLRLAGAQTTFQIAFLTHQAWLMGDAMIRTLVRLCVTRRHLLEWLTAAQAKFALPLDAWGFYKRMVGGVVLALAAAALLFTFGHGVTAVAAPLLAAWLLAPLLAHWASAPPRVTGATPASPADADALRLTARRTWLFFETFVVEADHMLPVDNFQEDPTPVVAHRTSPTNIGLYLLSVVSAYDFGWLGAVAALERLSDTLQTVFHLERYHGHLYNWYDTRDLRPLDPKYVSSVDSGNLAGHLIALANACREMMTAPVLHSRWRAGIQDAAVLTRAALTARGQDRRTQTVSHAQLREELDLLDAALLLDCTSVRAIAAQLATLERHADAIADITQTLDAAANTVTGASNDDLVVWGAALRRTVASHARDFDHLMPWARRLPPTDTVIPPPAIDPADPLATWASSWDGALPTLAQLADTHGECAGAEPESDAADREPLASPAADPRAALESSAHAAAAMRGSLASLAERALQLVDAMDFSFLLDRARQLLSIGYQVADDRLDPSCYDLLASEARLASFVAIAKGDVPARHWFRLGRSLTPVDRGSALISWSGSMFEYLMPVLVMSAPNGSLLERTNRFVVRRQIRYGVERGTPWGVSESAYNVRDLELTYQYSTFGIPGLGLKRGLSEDAVVAPYATGLGAMVDARAAAANFERLTEAGGGGRYGFYEALDYTAARRPEGEPVAIVRAYMAHHQGMTLVALANTLLDNPMQRRFHAEPMVRASELLLQERTPRDVAVARPRAEEIKAVADVRELVPPTRRRFESPHDAIPRTHLLSNQDYAVMLTSAGSGYSRWRNCAITRWQEDVTCDSWGTYVFLRDSVAGSAWSAGYQPLGVEPDSYEVEFSEDKAEISRRDGSLVTTLQVAVSPESAAEVRRVSLSNLGSRSRTIDVTSYAEIVLSPAAADSAHPAFSKLFVHTEFVPQVNALLATRRRRSPTEPEVWAAHLVVVEGESVGEIEVESDRAEFLGRGQDLRAPLAIMDGRPLSGTVGDVLDPIFSIRCRVHVPPRSTVRVAFWTMAADSRAAVLDLADKHCDAAAFERAVTLAWTQAQVQLHHRGCTPDEAHLFQRLANHVLYSDPTLRPSSEMLKRNLRSVSLLWAYGISGDVPILLARIDDPDSLPLVRQLLRAHEYLRMKQLAVDLVILNERSTSYAHDLQVAIEALVRTSQPVMREGPGATGRVVVLRAELVSLEVRNLLPCLARAVLVGRRGSLAEQLTRVEDAIATATPVPVRAPWRPLATRLGKDAAAAPATPTTTTMVPEVEVFNGLGGFAANGREYVTILGGGQWTPAPWINVVANSSFGFQTSVEGGGYTWAGSSREHQLTQWSNDPVTDRPGEVIYIRDEDSGALWCPTASPIRDHGSPYVARFGFGYSRFDHAANGIEATLVQSVALDDPIKISRLTLHNQTPQTRHLSITLYVEWVLGLLRGRTASTIVTEVDSETSVLLARNPASLDGGERVAFMDLSGRQTAWTGDRSEFLGRHGSLARPAALLARAPLSKRSGAGLDPCGVLQAPVTLAAGDSVEIVLFLGEGESRAEAIALALRYRSADLAESLRIVTREWDAVLGAVQVRTPDRSMDILLNGWLLYQTLACRVLARSAFYQASGAYGFRDQLQDVMALAVAKPELTRAHLLRAAARQFLEGDVQHWWLPPSGQGVRTRVTDDRAWLAFVTKNYLDVTGDDAVLDERVPFLEGPALADGEADSYFQPVVADENASLFEHCARALDGSLAVGSHGLPLMGGGDWNDGMNRVGIDGKGESVWLAWFLHAALMGFAPVAEARGEWQRARNWRLHASAFAAAAEREAWDGEWYRRGYFDDGTPLGSAQSEECRIDSIAQSWSVLSGAADPQRALRAMAAVDEHLVRRDDALVLLFAPPFAHTTLDPGYIRGYPPGVRENGGQYTHAAAWVVMAYAQLGDGDKAAEVFGLLNPLKHARTRAASHRYKVEPYVVSADICSQPPHAGRGGWTWYTGSAGWLYRAGLESILGFRRRGDELLIAPCIPRSWPRYEITFRHGTARYEIAVENPDGVSCGVRSVEIDGVIRQVDEARVALVDDGATHRVRITLGMAT